MRSSEFLPEKWDLDRIFYDGLFPRASISIAGDYASLRSSNAVFYYGYEIEDSETGELCFEARFPDVNPETGESGTRMIRIPYSKLKTKADQWDCASCLLKGIAWILERYHLADCRQQEEGEQKEDV